MSGFRESLSQFMIVSLVGASNSSACSINTAVIFLVAIAFGKDIKIMEAVRRVCETIHSKYCEVFEGFGGQFDGRCDRGKSLGYPLPRY